MKQTVTMILALLLAAGLTACGNSVSQMVDDAEREVAEALSLMKTHQMIELPCAIADVEDKTPIYLYHTINVFCSGAAIGQLCRKYGVKEETDENA